MAWRQLQEQPPQLQPQPLSPNASTLGSPMSAPRVVSPTAQSPPAAATPHWAAALGAPSAAGFGSAMQPPSPRRRLQASSAPSPSPEATPAAVPVKLEARLTEALEEAAATAAVPQPAGGAYRQAVPAAATDGQPPAATSALDRGPADGSAAALALQLGPLAPPGIGKLANSCAAGAKPPTAAIESLSKAAERQAPPHEVACEELLCQVRA